MSLWSHYTRGINFLEKLTRSRDGPVKSTEEGRMRTQKDHPATENNVKKTRRLLYICCSQATDVESSSSLSLP